MPDKSITIKYDPFANNFVVVGGDDPEGNGDMTVQKRNAQIQIALDDPKTFAFAAVYIQANTPFPPGVYPPPAPNPPIPAEFRLTPPNLPTSAVLTLADADTDAVETTYYYTIGVQNASDGRMGWTDPRIVNRPV